MVDKYSNESVTTTSGNAQDAHRGVWSPAKNLVPITWEEFDSMAKALAYKLQDGGFDSIYAIPRGGLVLGVRLSHLLNLPLVRWVEMNPNTLVVDDISDTGETLKHELVVAQYHTKSPMKCATLHITPWTTHLSDFYVGVKNHKNTHIVYPWEAQ